MGSGIKSMVRCGLARLKTFTCGGDPTLSGRRKETTALGYKLHGTSMGGLHLNFSSWRSALWSNFATESIISWRSLSPGIENLDTTLSGMTGEELELFLTRPVPDCLRPSRTPQSTKQQRRLEGEPTGPMTSGEGYPNPSKGGLNPKGSPKERRILSLVNVEA